MENGPICWYAMRIMKRKNLIPYMSWKERQTSKEILQDVDLLVCMRQSQLDFCKNKLGYTGKQSEVWEILDLGEMNGFISSPEAGIEKDINHIKLTEQTYGIITQKVDSLLARVANNT